MLPFLLALFLTPFANADFRYGLWTYDSEANPARISRTENGYTLTEGRFRSAVNTKANLSILGPSDEAGYFSSARIHTSPTNETREVQFVKTLVANQLTSKKIESFPIPSRYDRINFSTVLMDSSGVFYLQGLTPRGKTILVYGVRGRTAGELNWDVVDYVPVKKMVPAPGGVGVVILTREGLALHAGAWNDRNQTLPRIQLKELNSELNLIQDIASGPVSPDDARLAMAVLWAPDSHFEKAAQIRLVSESTPAGTFPLKLTDAMPIQTSFEPRGLITNYTDMTLATVSAAIQSAPNPSIPKTRIAQRLERTPLLLGNETMCEVFVQPKPGLN